MNVTQSSSTKSAKKDPISLKLKGIEKKKQEGSAFKKND